MCIVSGVCGMTASDVHRCASLCIDRVHNVCGHWCLPLCKIFAVVPLICFCPSPGQILKLCPKKKSSFTYTFCKAVGLLGMRFHLFENECESWDQEGGSLPQTLGFLHEPSCCGVLTTGVWLDSRLLPRHHAGNSTRGL